MPNGRRALVGSPVLRTDDPRRFPPPTPVDERSDLPDESRRFTDTDLGGGMVLRDWTPDTPLAGRRPAEVEVEGEAPPPLLSWAPALRLPRTITESAWEAFEDDARP